MCFLVLTVPSTPIPLIPLIPANPCSYWHKRIRIGDMQLSARRFPLQGTKGCAWDGIRIYGKAQAKRRFGGKMEYWNDGNKTCTFREKVKKSIPIVPSTGGLKGW